MKHRVIYKITNNINGKIYIGKDSRNRKNYYGSGTAIKNAINKYGIDNFSKEIIDFSNSLDSLNERECYWIDFYKSYYPEIGYNRSRGGDGNWDLSNMTNDETLAMNEKRKYTLRSEKHRKKKSETMIEYFKNPQNRLDQSIRIQEVWTNYTDEKKEEIKHRLKEGTKERWACAEERIRASENWKTNNPMFLESVRSKVSIARFGGDNPFSKTCEIDGVFYDSIVDASKILNLTRNQLSYRFRSDNYPNYKKIN